MTYVIDSKDNEKDWAGEVGHINKELIKKLVPFTAKDKDVLIYVCGPPAFMKAISGDKAKVNNTHTRAHAHTAPRTTKSSRSTAMQVLRNGLATLPPATSSPWLSLQPSSLTALLRVHPLSAVLVAGLLSGRGGRGAEGAGLQLESGL